MTPFRRNLLLAPAIVALVFFIATGGMWIRSRYATKAIEFSRAGQSFQIGSDSRAMSFTVADQTPTMSAIVDGMTATPNGWVASSAHPVILRYGDLSMSAHAAQPNAPPLAITRAKFQAQGFIWYSGFTAPHADLSGPFPACKVDTFSLSYIEAVVLSALVMLIAGYYGLRGGANSIGRCPRCGCYLRADTGQCPECKTIPNASDISPKNMA